MSDLILAVLLARGQSYRPKAAGKYDCADDKYQCKYQINLVLTIFVSDSLTYFCLY